jgi:two-component system, LytTR family, sensor kinase
VFHVLRILIGDMGLPGGPHWNILRPANMLKIGAGWFAWSCLIYWMILGGMQAYRYYERYMSSELQLERLEKSYSQARMNALRMQLDPHFLFNALNTISSHVERDPKLTRLMIEHLGDLLRMSLESKDRQEVPLAEELAFLDHYLAIQKIRFGRRLKVQIDIAPEVRYAQVPSLFLQPLVENAIRHGISHRASGGTVEVTAEPVNGRLSIRVSDDGAGLPAGWRLENSTGLGLSVTRERIAGLYPDGAGNMAIHGREEGGTVVEIALPLRVMGEEANEASA